jgi:hypothetical protein
MKMERRLFALLATSALVGMTTAAPVVAQEFTVSIGRPPPPPMVETIPPPRAGYVWAPGYWRWENERHLWAPGRWIEERRGQRWVPDRWVEGPNGAWRFQPGHWARG